MSGDGGTKVTAERVPLLDRKEMGFVNVLADVAAADSDRGDINEQLALARHRIGPLLEADVAGAVVDRRSHDAP
jgi:hypothetical protein